MAKKGGLGLGRGLDALMGGGASNTPLSGLGSAKDIKKDEEGKPVNLPEGVNVDDDGTLWANPADFVANPKQPRTEFDQKKLEELADSIRENGIIEPIIIEPAGDGKFYIIAGERRTRASLLAGLTKVPVQIRKFDEIQRLQVAADTIKGSVSEMQNNAAEVGKTGIPNIRPLRSGSTTPRDRPHFHPQQSPQMRTGM